MTTHITSRASSSSPLLYRTIQLDALTSFLGAVGFLVIGVSPLLQIMGFTESALPLVIGVILLAYVGWLIWLTRQPVLPRRQVVLIIVINVCWVVAWLAVLILRLLPLTLFGELFVGLTVVAVALFALVEGYALSKMQVA